MKTYAFRILVLSILTIGLAIPSTFAQRQLGKKKGPTSKIYFAESEGDTQIQAEGRIYTARQATAFDAPGTVIETKAGSHNIVVYSNGTSMFVDENTRVEIERFTQDPMHIDPTSNLAGRFEPSASQMDIAIPHGLVGICHSEFISGSSARYETPNSAINVRSGKIAIKASPAETVIDLLEGDVTVRSGTKDVGGLILRAGERAVVRTPAEGGEPVVTISPIPSDEMLHVTSRVEAACNARKSVTFEVIERKAGEDPEKPGDDSEAAGAEDPQEIVPKPTVPSNPPSNIVISPDRLPGT